MRRRAFLGLGVLLPGLFSTEQVRADALGDLRALGVLRVGTSDDYAPFVKVTAQGREGLDVDLVNRLAQDLGLRVAFVPFKWPELTTRLEQGSFDVVASGVTMRADRLFFGSFSRPYAVTGAVACVRKEDGARFAARAALNAFGVRIAVNRGGHLASVARTFFPRATLELLDDNTMLFQRVTTRAADAALSDSAEARGAPKELVTLPALTRDRKALYVRRDAKALARRVDELLLRYEADGSLHRARRRWLGDNVPPGFSPYLEAVLADVELRFDLMPSVGAAKRALGKPLEDREQEARVVARVRDLARAEQLDQEAVHSLWNQLIAAAKIIQLAPVFPASPTATLEALRDVIGGVDEHLLASLRAASGRVVRADYERGVETAFHSELLPRALLKEVASALAAVHRVQ